MTDRDIIKKLRTEDPLFRKLYEAWEEIDGRFAMVEKNQFFLVKQKVYEAILLCIDIYREDHSLLNKKNG